MDQGGERDFNTIVFNVADVAGVYVSDVGDIFLGKAFGEANFTDFCADSGKIDFFHRKPHYNKLYLIVIFV